MKKIIITVLVLFLLFFFTGNYLINTQNKYLVNFKRLFSDDLKLFLKETIFIIPDLKKKILKLEELNTSMEKIISETEKKNDIANEVIFPKTQFLKLNFSNYDIQNVKSKFDYERFGQVVEPFYIDIWDDLLIFTLKDGQIFFIKKNTLINKEIKIKKINHNLNNDVEISDILIFDKKIYLMFSDKDEESCNTGNVNLYSAKLDLNYLEFEKELFIKNKKKNLLKYPECLKYSVTAGKMTKLNDQNILFSSSVWKENDAFENNNSSTNNYLSTNKFSVFLKFNLKSKKYEIFSKGHRNPIGVYHESKTGEIIATEHGPRGGDEINRIIQGKNYGWPIVSYGEPYGVPFYEPYYYQKNHLDLNFQDPIYSFVPSIGISDIIKVGDKFSDKWKNNFLVGSLKKRSLFRVEFDKNFYKINFIEKIFIGRRIRDMIYDNDLNLIFLALEDGSPSIGVISAE